MATKDSKQTVLRHLVIPTACLALSIGCDADDGTLAEADGTTDGTGPSGDPSGSDNDSQTVGEGDGLVTGECGTVLTPTYSFESQFVEGADSVSYSGQIARHVLIKELGGYIEGLTSEIDDGASYGRGELLEALRLYVDNPDGVLDNEPISFTLGEEGQLAESVLADISEGKNLFDKLAGNDPVTDHTTFSDPGTFLGWRDMTLGGMALSAFTPSDMLEALFNEIETNAVGHSNGDFRTGPDGETLPVHLTEDGRDLNQLVQKFLLGAITFHQGADDYLSDDVDGKGLLSSPERDEEEPFSHLEHAWDEAFGYFGAARDYDQYTDEEIAAKGGREEYMNSWHDTNGDCAISLRSEINFGASQNAAKRDFGAVDATDFTGDAFEAFVAGRQIIADAAGPLSDDEFADLVTERNRIVGAWEKAIAATVVHYINDTIADIDAAIDGSDYVFADQAKHWSEMKGFALAFQFNPMSPVSSDEFEELHELLADAPVIPDEIPATNESELEAYRDDLLEARALLQDAYDFTQNNVEGW